MRAACPLKLLEKGHRFSKTRNSDISLVLSSQFSGVQLCKSFSIGSDTILKNIAYNKFV